MPSTVTDAGHGRALRSGFVSILGRPNAGKSTLMNALVGTKVSIVADKPQTTRTSIQGVLTTSEAQVVFLDTPGIHKSDTSLNKRMMHSVRAALDQRDLLLYVCDASRPFAAQDRKAIGILRHSETPTFLILNKIDTLEDKAALLPLIEHLRAVYEFAEYLPVSALTGEGLDKLRDAIIGRLPEGPAYFPPDHITDQPERFLVSELIREKILRHTHQEVPHSVAVLIDKWEDAPAITRVYASVIVEKDGQKGIIIGAHGSMLKRIGTEAREEIERLLDRRFFLDIHIKVQPGWREKAVFLNALDWRTMAGSDES